MLQQLGAQLASVLRLPFPRAADVLPQPSALQDRLLSFDASTGQPRASDFTATQVASAIAAAKAGAARSY